MELTIDLPHFPPLSTLTRKYSEIIVQFLDNPKNNSVLFYLNQREDLLPAIKFPNQLKKKSVYFLKNRQNVQVTEKLDQALFMGDLPASPLDFLSNILEEVYLPLLSNPKNLESWPEVVANDVIRHFHRVNGAVYVISGKAKVGTLFSCSTSEIKSLTLPFKNYREKHFYLYPKVPNSKEKPTNPFFTHSKPPSLTGPTKSKKSLKPAVPHPSMKDSTRVPLSNWSFGQLALPIWPTFTNN